MFGILFGVHAQVSFGVHAQVSLFGFHAQVSHCSGPTLRYHSLGFTLRCHIVWGPRSPSVAILAQAILVPPTLRTTATGLCTPRFNSCYAHEAIKYPRFNVCHIPITSNEVLALRSEQARSVPNRTLSPSASNRGNKSMEKPGAPLSHAVICMNN